MKSATPFAEEQDVEVTIDLEKPRTKAGKKLRGHPMEARIHELMLRNLSIADIQETLKREEHFRIGYHTLREYRTNFFDKCEDQAVKKLRDQATKNVDLDDDTIEKVYNQKKTYKEYLEAEFNRLAVDAAKHRADIEDTGEDGKGKLKKSQLYWKTKLVLDLEDKMRDIREKIAEVMEGPAGYVVATQEVAKEISGPLLKLLLPFVPKDKLVETRVAVKEIMKKWDEL